MKLIALLSLFLVGCVSVRQQDIDKWTGAPVEALDFHKFFMTIPMTKTFSNGIEIRNYSNSKNTSNCTSTVNGVYLNTNCSASSITCNNIFYIKEKKVIKYEPIGRCYTDETVWPSDDYKQFIK